MTTIDAIDRRILAILQADASGSLDEVAEQVNLSRNACWRRIQRLEQSGIIRRRVALLDAAKLGLSLTVLVKIRTSRHDVKWTERFRAAINSIPEIVAAYRTAGETDYVLHAIVADVQHYDRLYQRLIARVEMVDVSASFVMEEIKSSTTVPI